MANEFLFGVPGKLKDIYDYLTGTLKPELDTKATSSEVAKASVCTETRLARLNANVSQAFPLELVTVDLAGSGTWSRPADMIGDLIFVTGCGGGGGGGGASYANSVTGRGAGGAGAVSAYLAPMLMGASLSYSIGAGGIGGTETTNASNGGDTVIDAGALGKIVLYGGGAGLNGDGVEQDNFAWPPLQSLAKTGTGTTYYSGVQPDYSAPLTAQGIYDGGFGGITKSSSIHIPGGAPIGGNHLGGTSLAGGGGGASFFGDGGNGCAGISTPAQDGQGPGAGGGAGYAYTGVTDGGNGADGFLKISYYRKVSS